MPISEPLAELFLDKMLSAEQQESLLQSPHSRNQLPHQREAAVSRHIINLDWLPEGNN